MCCTSKLMENEENLYTDVSAYNTLNGFPLHFKMYCSLLWLYWVAAFQFASILSMCSKQHGREECDLLPLFSFVIPNNMKDSFMFFLWSTMVLKFSYRVG